jgi:hypothetical protein
MKTLLHNGLKNTYNKREVDSRIRLLNEKEVALQVTDPDSPKYVVIGVYLATITNSSNVTEVLAGKTYELGAAVANNVKLKITEIDTSTGAIKKFTFNETDTYTVNPESVSQYTSMADEQDEWDDKINPNPPSKIVKRMYPITQGAVHPENPDLAYPTDSSNSYAWVTIISRYAPGPYPSYGTLAHSTGHDPLVQASYMMGYVEKKLEDAVTMTFKGYVSKNDPRWPWSANVEGDPNTPITPIRPEDSSYPYAAELSPGNLWYCTKVTPTPEKISQTEPYNDTGDIPPESFLDELNTFNLQNSPYKFPWGTNSNNHLYEWNGTEWVDYQDTIGDKPIKTLLNNSPIQDGYTPGRLDLWELLNIDNSTNEGAFGQNKGFYWLDQWILYTFSVDETKFVHRKGTEQIDGVKTITKHLVVPVKSKDANGNLLFGTLNTETDPDFASKSRAPKSNEYATEQQIVDNAVLLRLNQTDIRGDKTFKDTHTLEGRVIIGKQSGDSTAPLTVTSRATPFDVASPEVTFTGNEFDFTGNYLTVTGHTRFIGGANNTSRYHIISEKVDTRFGGTDGGSAFNEHTAYTVKIDNGNTTTFLSGDFVTDSINYSDMVSNRTGSPPNSATGVNPVFKGHYGHDVTMPATAKVAISVPTFIKNYAYIDHLEVGNQERNIEVLNVVGKAWFDGDVEFNSELLLKDPGKGEDIANTPYSTETLGKVNGNVRARRVYESGHSKSGPTYREIPSEWQVWKEGDAAAHALGAHKEYNLTGYDKTTGGMDHLDSSVRTHHIKDQNVTASKIEYKSIVGNAYSDANAVHIADSTINDGNIKSKALTNASISLGTIRGGGTGTANSGALGEIEYETITNFNINGSAAIAVSKLANGINSTTNTANQWLSAGSSNPVWATLPIAATTGSDTSQSGLFNANATYSFNNKITFKQIEAADHGTASPSTIWDLTGVIINVTTPAL